MFLEAKEAALPSLDSLGIYSQRSTAPPSQPLTPKDTTLYILDESLGGGGGGEVYRLVDVSTGAVFAGKEFSRDSRESRTLWLKRVQQEVDIMRRSDHVRLGYF